MYNFINNLTDSKKKDSLKNINLVDKYLFEARTIFIVGQIDFNIAQKTCSYLLALSQASNLPITIIISSPGGHVESGDMIHDIIKIITPKVRIIGTGWVASAGALIYVSVSKEHRYCTPNTRFLLHQPAGGTSGMASDIAIQANEIIKMRNRLNKIFSQETNQKIERIEKDTDRDYWMSSQEGVKYGLVGKIINNITELN